MNILPSGAGAIETRCKYVAEEIMVEIRKAAGNGLKCHLVNLDPTDTNPMGGQWIVAAHDTDGNFFVFDQDVNIDDVKKQYAPA